jgi:RNA polymerase sigma-70 factor (ECF subfamily)
MDGEPQGGAGRAAADLAAAPDADLVAGVRAGDRRAFAALVERHGGPLLRLAGLFLRDPSAAEEIVQDTWVAVLDGLSGFEGRSSFKTWLFRILANRARTRAVRDRRLVPFSSLAQAEGDEPAVEPERFRARGHWADPPVAWNEETPERLALGAETRGVLEEAIGALPPAQRAVLVLRDFEGLATDEICGLLDLTEGNQRVLLHRARSRVRGALERYARGRRR